MRSYFGTLTIGADPVQITPPIRGGLVNKMLVQHAPGNAGNFKVGVLPNLTSDNTTPGIFVAATGDANPDGSEKPGGTWGIESYSDKNDINPLDYYFHGTHVGDVLMYQVTVKV